AAAGNAAAAAGTAGVAEIDQAGIHRAITGSRSSAATKPLIDRLTVTGSLFVLSSSSLKARNRKPSDCAPLSFAWSRAATANSPRHPRGGAQVRTVILLNG